VKLKVFYAADGDCLLLTSGDGRHALIDGGRSTSFQKVTWPAIQGAASAPSAMAVKPARHRLTVNGC